MDTRTEPGIAVTNLLIMLILMFTAIFTQSYLFLGIFIGHSYISIVSNGFWPYLTDEEIKELKRQEWMEKQSKDDDKDRDS